MRKKIAFNPYLPSWEFIPDGEPHVFGDRIYIYGSHDRRNGNAFCEEDYVVWSAPVDDPGNWRCEGTVYKKQQDPLNGADYEGELPEIDVPYGTASNPHYLYAPDVAEGPDGRYYLYYSLDFTNVISVAVSENPAGPFEFLDFVRDANGIVPALGRWFDPAVLCEAGENYLYYGFAPPIRFPGMEKGVIPGAMMVKLADDMHTIISEPVCVANGVETAKGTEYEDHPFFEASSIRKIGNWYYFIYSSLQGHELCYGMSKTPEGPFVYKGVLVSNGDLGYQGNDMAVNYTGNNHGSLLQLGEDVFIFWHRHTHGTAFSRQGCADKIEIQKDGTIPQTEITSCGLNNEPLPARNTYPAYIACHLTEKDRSKVGRVVEPDPGENLPELPEQMPYITEEESKDYENGLKPYIKNLREGSVAGFKYFSFSGTESTVKLELRGKGSIGVFLDDPDSKCIGSVNFYFETWNNVMLNMTETIGIHALYFKCTDGWTDFASFTIE